MDLVTFRSAGGVSLVAEVAVSGPDERYGREKADAAEGEKAVKEPRHAASLSRAFRRAISRSAASRFRPDTVPMSGSTMMVVPSSVVMMER